MPQPVQEETSEAFVNVVVEEVTVFRGEVPDCGVVVALQFVRRIIDLKYLVGMRTSDTIIAINNDPEAPIFSVADIGIVGDLFTIVPAIVKELKRVKAQK